MRRVWRSAFLALLTVGVVSTAAWLVFFSSVLGVREIQVVGNLGLPAQRIQQVAGVADGKPWPRWTWPRSRAGSAGSRRSSRSRSAAAGRAPCWSRSWSVSRWR
ncbi:hypothetical protein ACFQX6_23540 [Streptosporangium lutulentum]